MGDRLDDLHSSLLLLPRLANQYSPSFLKLRAALPVHGDIVKADGSVVLGIRRLLIHIGQLLGFSMKQMREWLNLFHVPLVHPRDMPIDLAMDWARWAYIPFHRHRSIHRCLRPRLRQSGGMSRTERMLRIRPWQSFYSFGPVEQSIAWIGLRFLELAKQTTPHELAHLPLQTLHLVDSFICFDIAYWE